MAHYITKNENTGSCRPFTNEKEWNHDEIRDVSLAILAQAVVVLTHLDLGVFEKRDIFIV